jgi:hypothetical protein
MECTYEEVGMSQCLCQECKVGWASFLESTAKESLKPKRCEFDPECECSRCISGRVATEGFTLQELLGDTDGLIKFIEKHAGYSGRAVGFELVNGICWVWDFPLGRWDGAPSFVVPASPAGLQTIVKHFDYCL